MAVYRVTLPSGGLQGKWAGRPPPPAPEELYTGPRRDGLLSTDEISGDYCCCFFPVICNSMTVVPHGPDAIETWSTCCILWVYPPSIGLIAQGGVRTRDPGTNTFDGMTFSADGSASGCYKKRQTSQKRTFQKVDARDLAGKWSGCFCFPMPLAWPLSPICCTRRKALNEDQYEESGRRCFLGLPMPISGTRTRQYVNGLPTNRFDGYDCCGKYIIHRYRDPGCAGGGDFSSSFFAKKLC